VLWNILKSKKLNARKFRRQYSIGNYIVDFFFMLQKNLELSLMEIRILNINQPPRPVSANVSKFKSGPATPPPKGGEMYQT
jgi:hypothetical protein